MSLLNKGPPTPTNDKRPSLNPNAAEFVPFALRSPSSTTTAAANADQWSRFATAGTTTVGKSVLDRTESSVSNNSDDEAHQYWRHQLPDDITPDFKVTGEEDSHGINSLPFSSFSLAEVKESSRFFSPSSATSFMLKEQQQVQQRDSSPSGINGGYSVSPYGEDHSPVSYNDLHAKPWDHHQIMDNENLVHGFLGDVLNEPTDLNPIDFLASQFPGYSAESLADIYLGSGGDLNLTVETLTQLELQVEGGGLSPNMNPETLSAPNLNALNFPALSVSDCQNGMPKFSGDDHQHVTSPYHRSTAEKENLLMFKTSNSFPSRSGSVDFASAVRKLASQDYGMWKYDRNGSSADVSVGSSRSSHVLASSYNGGQSRSVYGTDRLQSRGSSRSAAPVWLETGEAVGNMYTEMREEARDHARLRNVYFEQARQAYLIGNKALAKELSIKGQLHNIQMKAAHGKAQESIYRQRNPVSSQMMSQQHERVIDLHGLHVSEAIHVLKKDLAVLRSACARSATNLQVYICVGTGHHTRGSRTPARLPTAVQRYLLEEEGLDFTEPQPGLLRVIIC